MKKVAALIVFLLMAAGAFGQDDYALGSGQWLEEILD